jgi:hypothetical protein
MERLRDGSGVDAVHREAVLWRKPMERGAIAR